MKRFSSFNPSLAWKVLTLGLIVLVNLALISRLVWGSGSLYTWQSLKERKAELSQELSELDAQRAALSKEIRLLKTDPAYVEKVIRQRLNYVRKNEILYLFDKNRQDSSVWNENGTEKHE
ncbi:MAG: septum formation initiator family protein [Mailhella sp.]|nr:septum formation initiator family protein [Mailhella sp.]